MDLIPTDYVRSFHDSINWKNRLIGILGQKGVGKSTMILQHIKLYDKIDESLYVQADDFYFAGHRIYDLAFEAYRHFRAWKPLEQTIEQAYRPYSGVEWHFACSMRSKGRHRAGQSAPQPPRTPLALLDELHEERMVVEKTLRRPLDSCRKALTERGRPRPRERLPKERCSEGWMKRSGTLAESSDNSSSLYIM